MLAKLRRHRTRNAGIYSRQGRFFVQPYDRTTDGVLIGSQPIEILEPSASDQELGTALQLVLNRFRSGAPHPEDWSKVPIPLPEAAGVKSWSTFVKNARGCEISDNGTVLKLIPTRNAGAREGFRFLNDLAVEIPSSSAAEEIGRAVRKALALAE